jgi:hypothetical protein
MSKLNNDALRGDQNGTKSPKDELNELDLDKVSGGLEVYGGTLHPIVLSSNGVVLPF